MAVSAAWSTRGFGGKYPIIVFSSDTPLNVFQAIAVIGVVVLMLANGCVAEWALHAEIAVPLIFFAEHVELVLEHAFDALQKKSTFWARFY